MSMSYGCGRKSVRIIALEVSKQKSTASTPSKKNLKKEKKYDDLILKYKLHNEIEGYFWTNTYKSYANDFTAAFKIEKKIIRKRLKLNNLKKEDVEMKELKTDEDNLKEKDNDSFMDVYADKEMQLEQEIGEKIVDDVKVEGTIEGEILNEGNDEENKVVDEIIDEKTIGVKKMDEEVIHEVQEERVENYDIKEQLENIIEEELIYEKRVDEKIVDDLNIQKEEINEDNIEKAINEVNGIYIDEEMNEKTVVEEKSNEGEFEEQIVIEETIEEKYGNKSDEKKRAFENGVEEELINDEQIELKESYNFEDIIISSSDDDENREEVKDTVMESIPDDTYSDEDIELDWNEFSDGEILTMNRIIPFNFFTGKIIGRNDDDSMCKVPDSQVQDEEMAEK